MVNDGLQGKHAKKTMSTLLHLVERLARIFKLLAPPPPPIQSPTPLARAEGRRLTPIQALLELAFKFWCRQGVQLVPQACPIFEDNKKGRRRAAAFRKRMCSPSGSLSQTARRTNTRLPSKERTAECSGTRRARLSHSVASRKAFNPIRKKKKCPPKTSHLSPPLLLWCLYFARSAQSL